MTIELNSTQNEKLYTMLQKSKKEYENGLSTIEAVTKGEPEAKSLISYYKREIEIIDSIINLITL